MICVARFTRCYGLQFVAPCAASPFPCVFLQPCCPPPPPPETATERRKQTQSMALAQSTGRHVLGLPSTRPNACCSMSSLRLRPMLPVPIGGRRQRHNSGTGPAALGGGGRPEPITNGGSVVPEDQPDKPSLFANILKPLRDFGIGRTSMVQGGVGLFVFSGIGMVLLLAAWHVHPLRQRIWS